MIHWSHCCCQQITFQTAVDFLPVLNSRSLKAPKWLALKLVYLWVSLGFHKFQYFGISYSISLKMTWEFVNGFSIHVHHFQEYMKVNKLNAPGYEYDMSFQLHVCSFFQKYSMVFSLSVYKVFHFIRSHLCCLVWLSQSQGLERWAHEESECPFPPLCTYSLVTSLTAPLGHVLPLCLQVSPLLGMLFESECSPYYWDVHKHSPNACPGFKSPRYTQMWMILSSHEIVWNKETSEQAISCLFLSLEPLELNFQCNSQQ